MRASLDDPALLALDKGAMFERIAETGAELVAAWRGAEELKLPQGAERAAGVVLGGMGGSATAADYLAALCRDTSSIPISVVRDYQLPAFVDERTLVVVSSYSGETAEALSLYADARGRGAMLMAVTTGGSLGKKACADGVPRHEVRYRSLPRAAIAHGLAPLLRVASRLGLIAVTDADVAAAGDAHANLVRSRLGVTVAEAANPAKQLARALAGRTAIVVGAEHLAPVAVRFKNQLSENGKVLAAADAIPELDHNLVVGLETGAASGRWLTLVTLESERCTPAARKRCEVTAHQFERAGVPVERVLIDGGSVLGDLVVGTAWSDFVSCYVALLNGVDPSPITQIEAVKAALG